MRSFLRSHLRSAVYVASPQLRTAASAVKAPPKKRQTKAKVVEKTPEVAVVTKVQEVEVKHVEVKADALPKAKKEKKAKTAKANAVETTPEVADAAEAEAEVEVKQDVFSQKGKTKEEKKAAQEKEEAKQKKREAAKEADAKDELYSEEVKAKRRLEAKMMLTYGLNERQTESFHIADRGASLLLIGAAGTGKSEVTRRIREGRILSGCAVAACAPFGVAACNVNGFTIHSTFSISTHDLSQLETLEPGTDTWDKLREKIATQSYKDRKELWQTMNTLVIDEISTCNSTTFAILDYMAKLFRRNDKPFGGIQVVAVGDFLQLPPVEGDWAFNCQEFEDLFGSDGAKCVELTEVVRQADDPDFMELLHVIRNLDPDKDETVEHYFVKELLQRTCSVIESSEKLPPDCVRIVPLRAMAEKYNLTRMQSLDAKTSNMYISYDSNMRIDTALSSSFLGSSVNASKTSARELLNIDKILDDMLGHSKAETVLELRKGARVMQLSNVTHTNLASNADSGKQVVNGHTGTVVDFVNSSELTKMSQHTDMWTRLRKRDNMPSKLPLVKWDHSRQSSIVQPGMTQVGDVYNTKCRIKKRLQLPLAPAWAITAHKCQGMTLEGNVSVSMKHSFAPGQCYVALSRSKLGKATYIDGLQDSIRGLYASREALDFLKGIRG